MTLCRCPVGTECSRLTASHSSRARIQGDSATRALCALGEESGQGVRTPGCLSGSQAPGRVRGGDAQARESPPPRGFHFFSQPGSGPPAWRLMTQPQRALPLGAAFLEEPISGTGSRALKSTPEPPGRSCSTDPKGLGYGARNPSPAAVGGPGRDPDPGG